jgi:lycopene epsilon-cyclase
VKEGASSFSSSLSSSSSSSTSFSQATTSGSEKYRDVNEYVRAGGSERRWLLKQASKSGQRHQIRTLKSALKPFAARGEGEGEGDGKKKMKEVDILVVGCGPAGMALACELAERSAPTVKIGLLGPDVPFVNTYGVWEDEFASLDLEHCLERVFDDAVCHFGDGPGGVVRVGRKYAKVDLNKLQDHLLGRCEKAGVVFEEDVVESISDQKRKGKGSDSSIVQCKDGLEIKSRLTILASGAASSKFLQYEDNVPAAGAQTAYGFEVELDGGDASSYPFDRSAMLFMDFRRHHTGIWEGIAMHPGMTRALQKEFSWGTREEVPSFLYAMYLGDNKAFFQETCLVAKDAMPFAVLKRRLESRMQALGVKVKSVLDEEWSYIPVGGPLPKPNQNVLAFGAAANMIHPASGYSLARSLKLAPKFAGDIVDIYESGNGKGGAAGAMEWSGKASEEAWDRLWSDESRKCAAFHIFGMELLALMDVKSINDFFLSFFSLPDGLWKGFLSSSLDSNRLLFFALFMFAVSPVSMKARLVGHLMFHPSGGYLLEKYHLLPRLPESEVSKRGQQLSEVL